MSKCKTKDCKNEAWQLSSSDTRIGVIAKNGDATFKRVIRFKCEEGHYNEATSKVTINLFKKKPKEPTKDSSVKRFHRKDFMGHVVNDYSHQLADTKPDPNLSNHDRLVARERERSVSPITGKGNK